MPVPGDWVRTCPHCGSVKAAFQTVTQIITTEGSSAENRWWIVAKCPACGALVVAELNPNTQRVMAIYPEDVGAWPVGHLPAAVAREWEEATKVFRIGAYGSAVVACGRTLEAASLDLGVEGRTLQQRIQRMLVADLITARFGEVMDYVRLIRNIAAHAGKPVSLESTEGTMRFTQQALRLLYEVPGELARLRSHPPELNGPQDEDDVAAWPGTDRG